MVQTAEASGLTFCQQLALQILDWPLFAAVVLIVVLLMFRSKLAGVLERGGFTLVWGNKSLEISELPAELDESFGSVTDDIDEVKERLAVLEDAAGHSSSPPAAGPPLTEDGTADARFRIREGLASSQYRWRSIPRLASIGGVSEDQALVILGGEEDVVLSRGKSGRAIARLRDP